MISRKSLDDMTSDDLDQLWARLDHAERLASHLAHDLADIYHQNPDTVLTDAEEAIHAARHAVQEQT